MAKVAKKHLVLNSVKAFDQLKELVWEYNIEYLAGAAGVCQATLYNWCDGTTQHPRLTTVVKVAKAMGYEVTFVKTGKKPHLKVVK